MKDQLKWPSLVITGILVVGLPVVIALWVRANFAQESLLYWPVGVFIFLLLLFFSDGLYLAIRKILSSAQR